MKKLLLALPLLLLLSCSKKADNEKQLLHKLACDYVRLGLTIGQYDEDFVDAYYGPDSLKPKQAVSKDFPKDSLLASINILMNELKEAGKNATIDSNRIRANWLYTQLIAFGERVRIFSGDYLTFDDESKQLFGVTAPIFDDEYFETRINELDSILPGKGNVNDRFEKLANKFAIPKDKLDAVMKAAIAEARKRTLKYYQLPAGESFTLEYVTDKPWSGYNWYKGNYKSVIQINTDNKILVNRAIDVGSHESYPGHHVYNVLLEKNLYRDKGWIEMSLYPLFSPQSLVAEGSANYGIELAFPGKDKTIFTKNILLPLAGVDTADVEIYFKALDLKSDLDYARNEAARGLIDKKMSEYEARNWLRKHGLMDNETANKTISFIKKYRSYVINYNYGKDLIKGHIERNLGADKTPQKRWSLFYELLSNEINTTDLVKK